MVASGEITMDINRFMHYTLYGLVTAEQIGWKETGK